MVWCTHDYMKAYLKGKKQFVFVFGDMFYCKIFKKINKFRLVRLTETLQLSVAVASTTRKWQGTPPRCKQVHIPGQSHVIICYYFKIMCYF